jgi:glucose/arabinose dehydrogenase
LVPSETPRPTGKPKDFVTGFIKDGRARGRPVGVTYDAARGALWIADDLSNTVWRVTGPKALALSSPVGIAAGQK